MNDERFLRTEMLIGEAALAKLRGSCVMLFGLGGVGGYACEALARAGVGKLVLVDFDTVSQSNINRQILADDSTVGQKKTAVAAARVKLICPEIKIEILDIFVDEVNADALIAAAKPHYIIDAIDYVPGKLAIIRAAHERGIPVVSCMGTGNKLYPEKLQISDISKTHTCPLARSVRAKLRQSGIAHVDVLWSSELPRTPAKPLVEDGRAVPASISFVPSAAGLLLAAHVVRRLCDVE